ncbi:MAG: sulfatase [Planctomycetaceae bacterium]
MRSASILHCCVLLVVGWFTTADADDRDDRRPNVLLITADNLGYGDLGCYGNEKIKTPRLDRLAEQGVRCTSFYSASPTCTVSRACLLTGRYPQRHGLTDQLSGLGGNYGVGLGQREVLLPQVLKPAGYRTACFGKWNIGFAEGSRPTERGFDEFFGHASGNMDYYTHLYNGRLDMHRGTEPVRVDGYSTDLFADAACRFIREQAQVPFFVYLPFNAPHFPDARNKKEGQPTIWQAPDSAFRAYGYDPATDDERKRYFAVVTALDAAIGRVLDTLDETGLAEKTLVIFVSDNGAFMLRDRGRGAASNGPLRNGGITLFEGGIRVPCIVRHPGVLPAGRDCDEPLLSCDFFPMIAHVAGGKLPDNRTIDGRNPTAALAGEASSPHEALFFEYRSYAAMRQGRWKLLRTAPEEPFQLFDLENDLGEKRNLAEEHPQIVERLKAEWKQWRRNVERE